ncbi:hypothetical protein B0H10DRAFT_320429 [Mycena sp. CBHHK59/15]|nr:hypothetical protein B0H10DRAFT_320429 [Mycena sp. CBHHK59/15]
MENIASNDGMICISAYDLETEAFDGVKSLLGAKEVFAVGPLIPDVEAPVVHKAELEQSDDKGIVEFLDRMLTTKGTKSTLYVSFGSIFYPPVPEKLHQIIKVVIELEIPLVFVQPKHAPPIPNDILATLSSSGIGYVCSWAPQQYILNHPSVGYFLTHGGLNSTLEALHVGMPMINWPQYGDQPFLAILVEQVFECGYELAEVRRGHGMHTRGNGTEPEGTLEAVALEAREVLRKAFFDEADRKAKGDAAAALSRKLRAAWGQDGPASKALDAFIAFVNRPPPGDRVREARARDLS